MGAARAHGEVRPMRKSQGTRLKKQHAERVVSGLAGALTKVRSICLP